MIKSDFFTAKLKSIDIHSIINETIGENEDYVLDLNRNQMLEGLQVSNEKIRPLYSEDPFFKSKQAALAYAKWKSKIKPNPKRDLDTPNLYINGYFHNSIDLKINEKDSNIVPTNTLGYKITSKFKNVLGLTDDNKKVLSNFIKPDVITKFKTKLL